MRGDGGWRWVCERRAGTWQKELSQVFRMRGEIRRQFWCNVNVTLCCLFRAQSKRGHEERLAPLSPDTSYSYIWGEEWKWKLSDPKFKLFPAGILQRFLDSSLFFFFPDTRTFTLYFLEHKIQSSKQELFLNKLVGRIYWDARIQANSHRTLSVLKHQMIRRIGLSR